jgi:hypothetical protein
MSGKPNDFGREVRDTVVKSGLTGVAVTVLAVTAFSPAGFGGLIGTSLASGLGLDTNANATTPTDDPYAGLPPFPAPLSQMELETIRSQLARTTASLEITRAATEERIEHIRSIALTPGAVTFAPMRTSANVGGGLRLTTTEPEAVTPASAPAPAPVEAAMTPVSYAPNSTAAVEYRDPNLELAELLLAHETF